MGQVRERAVLMACRECEALPDAPCVHKKTGKPLRGMHKSRVWGAREDVLNQQVATIEGHEWADCLAWFARWLGLDVEDQYHGEF